MAVMLPKQVGTEEGKLLFQRSEKVENFNKGRKIVNLLRETLNYYVGIGLAAPQIGIPKRVFVVNIVPAKNFSGLPKIGLRAYINPEILETSSETNNDMEGCLSIFYATIYGQVQRASYAKVKYLDIDGEERIEEISHSFHIRVILHEIDHLDGKIFLQRMKSEDFSELCWNENLDIRKKDLK